MDQARPGRDAPLPEYYATVSETLTSIILRDIPGAAVAGATWNSGHGKDFRTVFWAKAENGNFIWQKGFAQPFDQYPMLWNEDQSGIATGQEYAEIPDSQAATLSFTGPNAANLGDKPVLMKTAVALADGQQVFLEYFDFALGNWRMNEAVLKALLPDQTLALRHEQSGQWSAIGADGKAKLTFDTIQNLWIKTLPDTFLVQGFDVKDGQVFWAQSAADEVLLGVIKDEAFVFQTAGHEVSVDPTLITVPAEMWFLNGRSDQTVAIYDVSATYWQYEWDVATKQWLEKSLPAVSANYSRTKITWNDIVSNRWATAVRAAIAQGKLATFDETKLQFPPMIMHPDLLKKYGMDGPSYSPGAQGEKLPTEARPVKAAAYAEIKMNGVPFSIVTEQFANASGGYRLINLLVSSAEMGRIGNEGRYFIPVTRIGDFDLVVKGWPEAKPYYDWFTRNFNGPNNQVRSSSDQWMKTQIVPAWFEKLVFRTFIRSW